MCGVVSKEDPSKERGRVEPSKTHIEHQRTLQVVNKDRKQHTAGCLVVTFPGKLCAPVKWLMQLKRCHP